MSVDKAKQVKYFKYLYESRTCRHIFLALILLNINWFISALNFCYFYIVLLDHRHNPSLIQVWKHSIKIFMINKIFQKMIHFKIIIQYSTIGCFKTRLALCCHLWTCSDIRRHTLKSDWSINLLRWIRILIGCLTSFTHLLTQSDLHIFS